MEQLFSGQVIQWSPSLGGLRPPKPPCLSGGLRPPDPPSSTTPNMSSLGHDTCSMIIVHACPMYDHSTCMSYDHRRCMYYDHSTCMYYDQSTCMYYDQCTCMYSVRSRCMDEKRRTDRVSHTAHDQRNLGLGLWGAKPAGNQGGFGGAPQC